MGDSKSAKGKTNAYVEIIHGTDKWAGRTDTAFGMTKAISASEAFRKYKWLAGTPELNALGDLRGKVISAKWRTVFNFSSDVGEIVGHIALLAAFAGNIVKASKQIEAILASNDPWPIKTSRLSTQVSSVAIRTVGGVVPAGFEVVAFSLQGYCQLGGVVTGQRFNPQQCISNLKKANTYVTTTFDKVTDGENIYTFINVHFN